MAMKKSSDIRKKFDTYIKDLAHQKKALSQQITEWRDKRIKDIKTYADRMNEYLEQEYNNRKQTLEQQSQQLTAQAAAQEKQNNGEKLQSLFRQCENLQIELAKLQEVQQPTTFINVIPGYQQTQNNRNEDIDNRVETDKSSNITQTISSNSISTNDTSSSRQSPRSLIALEQDTSRYNGNVATPNVQNEENTFEKCPICFMIFSISMTKQDRALHVNEHYGD